MVTVKVLLFGGDMKAVLNGWGKIIQKYNFVQVDDILYKIIIVWDIWYYSFVEIHLTFTILSGT